MPISGKELARLLRLDGWTEGRRVTHGIAFYKQFPGEPRPRMTVVPDKSDDLPTGTLGAILGVKQTGLGSVGLEELQAKHGGRR